MKVLVIFAVLVAFAYAADEAGASAEESAGLDVAGDVTDQVADEHRRHGYGARPYSSQGHRPYSSQGYRPYSSQGHRPYSRPLSPHGHGSGYRHSRSADEFVVVDQDAAEHHGAGYGAYYGGYSRPYYGGYNSGYYGGYRPHYYGGYYGRPYWG